MPVILVPNSSASVIDLANCTDLVTVMPADTVADGCPVLVKDRAIVVPQGMCAIVEWEIRNRSGEAVDLTTCLGCDESEPMECGKVVLRLASATNRSATCPIYELDGVVATDPGDDGRVRVQLDADIVGEPGLWFIQWGVFQPPNDMLTITNSGLLSVEPSLFGNLQKTTGPPTLNQIRTHLQDFAGANTLLGEVEFSDSDILEAISHPINEWNELPPPVAPHSPASFPYRFHYMQAVCGYLLRSAVHHYNRNRLGVKHGDMLVDDKNRASEYLQMSELLLKEWREFIAIKKISINAQLGNGSVESPYGYYGGY